jgi:hypothetical protein
MIMFLKILHRFDPEQSAELKGFDRETGVTGSGNNDDDVIEEPGCSNTFRNDKCPLTMKSVSLAAESYA